MTPRSSRYELGLLLSLVVFLVLSGIHPHDFFTWVLEVFPILIGVPILIWVYPRFRFTLTMTHPWWGVTFEQTGEFIDPVKEN